MNFPPRKQKNPAGLHLSFAENCSNKPSQLLTFRTASP
jgi:hypothetical protein